MKSLLFAARVVTLLLALVALPALATAQLISLQTVPVAAGDQFLIFPSQNLGMGGVAIALDDPLLDPFVNPAKGARISTPLFVTAPTSYSIPLHSRNVRTLPAGMLLRLGSWFGAGVAALQQIDGDGGAPTSSVRTDGLATNKYGYGAFGRVLPGGKLAVAASAYVSDLQALDGVDNLYVGHSGLEQFGHTEDYRLGLIADLGNSRAFEAVLVHNRFDMTHDVAYRDQIVDTTTWNWTFQWRRENNLDRTRTWGVHLGYQQAVGRNGWRIGGILTGNRKVHPKIPNYVIMRPVREVVVPPDVILPRDPGHSWAYDIGIGISKTEGSADTRTTFGMDLIYEPAWSHTWAEAEEAVATASGLTIPIGGKTVENRFRFSNALVNLGMTQRVDNVALQLGLQVRLYEYGLDQWDRVTGSFRHQDERWTEWTPTWGLSVRLGDLDLRYVGRVRVGDGGWGGGIIDLEVINQNDVLAAPDRPLRVTLARVVTHQMSIAVPIK